MVKLIQKSGFIKPGKAAGYIKYIATRDGVEVLPGPEGYMEYMATRPGRSGQRVRAEHEKHPGSKKAKIFAARRKRGPRGLCW